MSHRPLRVFQLVKGLGRGGAEMLLLEGERCRDPQRVTYAYGYLLPWKDALAGELAATGAEVTCFGARRTLSVLAAAPRIARLLRRWRADLVHCHLPLSGVAGRLAGRLARVPVVYTEHNLQERYHPATRWLNRLTWRWQREVAVVSGEVGESIRRHCDPGVPIRLVLNGVPVERFRPDPEAGARTRRRLGIGPAVPLVGTVAVFRRQKALEDWLHAAAALRALNPETRFLLVGDGPLDGELRQLAERLGLAEAVTWPGLVQDVRPFLAALDVYLMSSRFEGLPLALLEAMAMELPVVATRVGGIPEVVDHDADGWLEEPGKPGRLAKAVATLLADETRRRRIGGAARRRVVEGFSIERRERELEALYRRNVGPPRGGGR